MQDLANFPEQTKQGRGRVFHSLRGYPKHLTHSPGFIIHTFMSSTMEDDFEIIIAPVNETANGPATTNPAANSLEDVPRSEVERDSPRGMDSLMTAMQAKADENSRTGLLFFSDLGADRYLIYNTWLEGIPEGDRKVFDCRACRRFLNRYGSLCIINDDGTLKPLFWSAEDPKLPPYFKQAVANVEKLFVSKSVTDELTISTEEGRKLGHPGFNPGWVHMSVTLTNVSLRRQVDAMASQDTGTSYLMLSKVIEENTFQVIEQAHHMIHTHELAHATSHEGPITYLRTVVKKISEHGKNDAPRRNLINKYAREAFPGCLSSIRGGAVGCLMKWIGEGVAPWMIRLHWSKMANPLSYMRPTTDPSAGNIENAEEIFAKLGYKPYDIERVYLTLDQVPENGILWSPKSAAVPEPVNPPGKSSKKPGPIFGDLLTDRSEKKVQPSAPAPPTTKISFRKFAERVLPDISSMEIDLEAVSTISFFTTGKENSKPLMSFGSETNTASWYYWGKPLRINQASLCPGWIKVTSIISFPHMWEGISPMEAFVEEKAEAFKQKRHNIRCLLRLEGIQEKRDN